MFTLDIKVNCHVNSYLLTVTKQNDFCGMHFGQQTYRYVVLSQAKLKTLENVNITIKKKFQSNEYVPVLVWTKMK